MTIKLRPATPEDAVQIAELADIAGDGFPSAIWASTAEHGQTAYDVGAARAARDTGVFSYKYATIAECDGDIAGLAISYINGDTPEVISEQTHPMFRPMVMLENAALETRYVSMLSTYPAYRKTGVAQVLLDREEQMPGPKGMSLITSDHNAAARKFLEDRGFHEAAVVPAIKINWETPTKSWHLLRKP